MSVMTKAEAGLIGARRRWGEPRIVRIDSLTSEQRAVVLALVAAATKKATPADSTDVAQEVRHATDVPPTRAA